MVLPELLYEWAEERNKWNQQQAVVIVFPTQFGCLNIRDSLIEFREHPYWELTLRTGVDKDDRFDKIHTKFQVVTYGMMWHWLVKGGMQARDRLYWENCCFLLDEFSGKAPGGDPNKLKQIGK